MKKIIFRDIPDRIVSECDDCKTKTIVFNNPKNVKCKKCRKRNGELYSEYTTTPIFIDKRPKYVAKVDKRKFIINKSFNIVSGDYKYKISIGKWDNSDEEVIKMCYYHINNGKWYYVPNAPSMNFDIFFNLLRQMLSEGIFPERGFFKKYKTEGESK